ncbi:proteasome component Ecm29p [Diutina catenulata]
MADSELALINQVELRIALASSDAQLEKTLGSFLPPLLLKLASPHQSSRASVHKSVQNFQPRIKAAPAIQLPVKALLDQVKRPRLNADQDASSVRLYSLVFAVQGADRVIDETQRSALLLEVLEGISTFSPVVQARLFLMFLKFLPSSYARDSEQLAIADTDAAWLTDKITKFFFLQPTTGVASSTIEEDDPMDGSSSSPMKPMAATRGLSSADNAFFTRDAGVEYTGPAISATKAKLLGFIQVLSPRLRVVPFLIASGDPSSSINEPAVFQLKKLPESVVSSALSDRNIVTRLLDVVVGTKFSPPVGQTYQILIINFLRDSPVVASLPQFERLMEIGLAGDGKFKLVTLELLRKVSSAPGENTESFTVPMAAKLREDITASRGSGASAHQLALQYETLRNLLVVSPSLVTSTLDYVEFLFESLDNCAIDTRSSIQEVLGSVVVNLPKTEPHLLPPLKRMLRGYIVSENSPCKYMAVKFLNLAFPFSDPECRYLCLTALAKSNQSGTVEEATKGLHPHWFNILQATNTTEFRSTKDLLGQNLSTLVYPGFSSMVDQVAMERSINPGQLALVVAPTVDFMIKLMVMSAVEGHKTVIVPDEEWETRVTQALATDPKVRKLVIQYITEASTTNAMLTFVEFVMDITFQNSNLFANQLHQLVALCPDSLVAQVSKRTEQLLDAVEGQTLHDGPLIKLAEVFGIVASHPAAPNIEQRLSEEPQGRNQIRGRIAAHACFVSRCALRQSPRSTEQIVDRIKKLLKDSSNYGVAVEALSQLGKFAALSAFVSDDVFESIAIRGKKGDEKALLCVANLTVGQSKSTVLASTDAVELTQAEQTIYDSHVVKSVDFTFASGEALTIAVTGWQSTNLQRDLDIQGVDLSYIPEDTSRLAPVLQMVLNACANTKPALRKAGCIWLLSLVQFCGHLDAIKERASEIHLSFMKFFGDRDDLVQESATRGLSLVYEMGNADLKETLVKSLVRSFTDSGQSATKFSAGSVDEDTTLFDANVLNTGDGNSVSSYRDVLNLAVDVGDPSLVYKFMSMAKSSSLWSSRRGIAFGLGSILSKSSLEDTLAANPRMTERLIPRLYRYKFDPSTSVQTSMTGIWNILVRDSNATLNQYFTPVVDELLKGMGNKEWRVREASTTALTDLLQVIELAVYEDRLPEIWNMSFRVLDDIKESVRKAGAKLTKSLATTLTRVVERSDGAAAQSTLDLLIPFLLGNNGLTSDSKDIQQFSLDTILKLCKQGGPSIAPYIPELIDTFINLMSTLEPEIVNYLVLNADKYNLNHEEIDAQRLSALGRLPLMDAIDQLIGKLPVGAPARIDEFFHRLIGTTKKAVGLPSKVACSRVIVNLVSAYPDLVQPYAERLLQASFRQAKDRNLTVASAFATSCGYLCRVVSFDAIANYGKAVESLYFDSEDDEGRIRAAIASEAVAKYSGGDRFATIASAFLPLAFIGRFDGDKNVKVPFEREWVENTSSNTNAIKLYFTEISDYLAAYIKSNKFEIRRTLGRSVSHMASALAGLTVSGTSVTLLPDPASSKILDILIEANKGKSWEGKELFLEALVDFSSLCKSLVENSPELKSHLDRTMEVEAKRKNKQYQKHAIKLLGRYLHDYPNNDLYGVYIAIMSVLLSDKQAVTSDDSDSDEDEDMVKTLTTKENIEREEERIGFYRNLRTALAAENVNHPLLEFLLTRSSKIFESEIIQYTWRSKLAVNEEIGKVLELLGNKGYQFTPEEDAALFSLWKCLESVSAIAKNIEKVKIQYVRTCGSLLKMVSESHRLSVLDSLERFAVLDSSTVVKTEIQKVIKNGV